MGRTPTGGLRPALILLTAVAALLVAFADPVPAVAAHKPACGAARQAFPLHAGSCGQHVSDLQWVLGGHRPYVFRQVKPTFKSRPNGAYGARTKHAVLAMKYRIGYPAKGQCGAKTTLLRDTTSRYFFYVIEGKAKRPACWVALAASRVKAVNVGPTKAALRIRAYELHLLALGVHEVPDGSNRGPAISYPAYGVPALQSATGAYDVAWCVSTQQTVLRTLGYGVFADGTAGVYYAADWAAARNLLSAKPKVGAIVAFIDYDRYGHRIPGTGHMGYVVAVQASSFTYIAGNDGNAVREHTIPDGSRPYAFIYLPGIASGTSAR